MTNSEIKYLLSEIDTKLQKLLNIFKNKKNVKKRKKNSSTEYVKPYDPQNDNLDKRHSLMGG